MPSEIKSSSADGCFQICVDAWEARNSLWVESPTLRNANTGEALFRFSSELWSLDRANWISNETVELTLRKYPGNHTPSQLVATVDCQKSTAALDSLPAVALHELERLLESQLRWT